MAFSKFVLAFCWVLFLYFYRFFSSFLIKKQNKILLLIRTDALGDLSLFIRGAKEIRNKYSDYKIVIIVQPGFKKFLEDLEYFDHVIDCDSKRYRRNLIYAFYILKKIRRIHPEITINPIFMKDWMSDEFSIISDAKTKITISGDSTNISVSLKRRNEAYYSKIIHIPSNLQSEVERSLFFLNQLLDKNAKRLPSICLPNNIPSIKIRSPYIVISPGATWEGRIWPTSKFSQLINILKREEQHFELVLLGSHAEKKFAEQIIDQIDYDVIDLTGKTSITELAKIIKNAILFIGAESGPANLATALGTPTICILGGGHYGKFFPYKEVAVTSFNESVFNQMDCYDCNWKCIYDHPVCISSITVEKVYKKIKMFLNDSV